MSYQKPSYQKQLKSAQRNVSATYLSDERLIYEELRLVMRRSAIARREAADLFAAAWVGICEARHRFDPTVGVSFSTYARRRVRGAIYDALAEVMTPFGRRGSKLMSRAHRREERRQESEEMKSEEVTAAQDVEHRPRALSQVSYYENYAQLQRLHLDLGVERGPSQRDPLLNAQDRERQRLMREVVSEVFGRLNGAERELMIAVYDLREIGDTASAYARRKRVHRSTITRQHALVLLKLKDDARRELEARSLSSLMSSVAERDDERDQGREIEGA